jgi:hypothetical protein
MDARKDRIFRKVGRNVVNLQRIEQMLKLILAHYVDGPLKHVPEALKKRREALARQPMGPLTHEVVDRLIPDTSPQGEFELLATEVWISSSLVLEGNADLRRELKTNLKKLVDDRNELVHHMFGGFDLSSEKSCAQLEERLESQHQQISQAFLWVEQMRGLLKEHLSSLEAHLQDPQALEP